MRIGIFARTFPADEPMPVLAAVRAVGYPAARLMAEMSSARLRVGIAMAHAKGRDAGGRSVAAGAGVVDFPDCVARLRAAGFNTALVTHGLSPDEAPGSAKYLGGLA